MTVDEAPFPRKFSEESGECNGLFPTDSHFVRVGLLYKFKKAFPPTLTDILEIHISLRKVNWPVVRGPVAVKLNFSRVGSLGLYHSL